MINMMNFDVWKLLVIFSLIAIGCNGELIVLLFANEGRQFYAPIPWENTGTLILVFSVNSI